MTQSSRPTSPTEKDEIVVLQNGQISPLELRPFGAVCALSNRLIAITDFAADQIILADIGAAKPGAFRHEAHVIVENASRCCINDDKQLFVVLCRDKIMLWHLDDIKSVDDFKKIKPEIHLLDRVFGDNNNPITLFFSKNDSHIFVKHQTIPDCQLHLSSIDLKNGQRNLIEINITAHCLLNKRKLFATKQVTLFLYDIDFKDGQFAISNPHEFSPTLGNVKYCSVSADGNYLAVTEKPRGQSFYSPLTVNRYVIKQDDKFELCGYFSSDESTPYFTRHNAMVFKGKNSSLTNMVEHDSNTNFELFQSASACSCALPNGNIFEITKNGIFTVTRTRQYVYEQALATLLYTAEIGNAVPAFSVNVAKTIGAYLQDARFFSPKQFTLANRFEHETLKSVLNSLAVNPDVLPEDKDAIQVMLSSLQMNKDVEDSVDEALKHVGEKSGLVKFLGSVKDLFAVSVMLAVTDEDEAAISAKKTMGCRFM